jgi:hypothetical protein
MMRVPLLLLVMTAGVGWAKPDVPAMRAAMARGDVDEAARQGVNGGAAVVEAALNAPDRAARMAGIAAAPDVEGRVELLDALAGLAGGADRRIAIPAARAARAIARELAERELPDDVAGDDATEWRDAWAAIAMRGDRWIELRVLALDTAAALERAATVPGSAPKSIGVALEVALGDRDPAFRRAAVANVPAPVPAVMRAALGKAIASDPDEEVALAAGHALCFDLVADAPGPILEVIDAAGMQRLKTLVDGANAKKPGIRDVRRCLAAKR